uniref:Uncharacterized protein n=1 Tax=Rhodocyclus tenuis TaxID=1066 RepID=A0A840G277_RHOTE|nr:hypothetical protein [Rhodocyclus tenuis]
MTPTLFTRATRLQQPGGTALPQAPVSTSVKDGQEEYPC